MEDNTLNTKPEIEDAVNAGNNNGKSGIVRLLIPLVISLSLLAGFTDFKSIQSNDVNSLYDRSGRQQDGRFKNVNFLAMLTQKQFSENLRDTVYTDRNVYLELRIDEQMLYVHYKDGRVKQYPVSSGNKFLNKGIESRPGLFAIFIKEELHLSSQFDDAKMFYYMPFNMGIGFHSLAGTGYYGSLGVRPSSHGCIRMRNDDAKALFRDCDIGTLVLADRGKSARVIAFAPKGFKNSAEYTKDDYMNLLAYNLNSLYSGKYFINPPIRFIIDPSVIPRIGFNVGSTDDIPDKQQIPVMLMNTEPKSDRLSEQLPQVSKLKTIEEAGLTDNFQFEDSESQNSSTLPDVGSDLVKKLVYNPGGILPYFPPDKEKYSSSTTTTKNTTTDNNTGAEPGTQ
jgi:hypothetical protein